MTESQTTITISNATKRELALLKGDRSWDELLKEMAAHFPRDAAIEEAERRLAELRQGRAKAVSWDDAKARRASRSPRK
ncbi:MAG: hypothetical protein QOE90_299 [Thermoplasmata archaeon]|jgi:hypothetical protein|nr:hypothetical protein [Thermoplasmata archaeon]